MLVDLRFVVAGDGITRIRDRYQARAVASYPPLCEGFVIYRLPAPGSVPVYVFIILEYLILGIRSVTESQISTNDYFPGAHAPPQHLMRALPFRVRPSKKSFSQILCKLGFPDDERAHAGEHLAEPPANV